MDKLEKITKISHDGTLTIAVGSSRKELNWKNREMLWSQLVDKLKKTTRTQETYAEYKAMPKSQQDDIKDVGGFVGGTLKGGRRKADSVSWRQIITLDADFIKGDLLSAVDSLFGYGYVAYSTHKHRPDAPRIRLVIPLKRPVSPEEYSAVARRIAADISIDFFDDTTYEPHRLMYWPSTSSDGEYLFHHNDAEWANPDEYLNRYVDWKDPSYWPESSRQQKVRRRLADKQGDPLTKPGIIGAFNRTYPVSEAISTFLSDVYEPTGDGRYTYLAGSTTGGLVLYDTDTFCYSHHGTDPIGGLLVNAFDLVRIHKFGLQDEDAEEGTPVVRLPSYLAMQDFALADDAVKVELAETKLRNAAEDFDIEETEDDWTKKLEFNKNGEIKPSIKNMTLILRNDPNLKGAAYDEHKNAQVLLSAAPWRKPTDWQGMNWGDADDAALRGYIERVYSLYSPSKMDDALATVSRERSFHPVREYLDGLPEWDGIPRVEHLLIDYLGADDSLYVREATKKTLVAAVARVMHPGCKFDYMLVLNGPQGVGKSTLFQRLGGKWFSDSLTMQDTKDKTGPEKLQGYWIVEIGELAGIRKVEVESVKSFLSRQHDIYRPAYGRRTVELPRQCVVVGSTNNAMGFLRDVTGNRRFWPVTVKGVNPEKAPWNISQEVVDLIWAEALQIWRDGEQLFLTGDAAAEAFDAQRAAMEADERVGMVEDYLNTLLPMNWHEMDLPSRREFLYGDFGKSELQTGMVRDRVCVTEIWCECFCKDRANLTRRDMDEIQGLLLQLDGWKRYDGKLRFSIYGIQKAFVRDEQ